MTLEELSCIWYPLIHRACAYTTRVSQFSENSGMPHMFRRYPFSHPLLSHHFAKATPSMVGARERTRPAPPPPPRGWEDCVTPPPQFLTLGIPKHPKTVNIMSPVGIAAERLEAIGGGQLLLHEATVFRIGEGLVVVDVVVLGPDLLELAVAQKPVPNWNPGTWKHGPQPA